jgi:hypothetical protein
MVNVAPIAASIRAALEQSARCTTSETSENYDGLGSQVEALDEQAREQVQSQLAIASLLPKLKERKPLGPAELKTLELLIVGDAESFLKYEADLDRWKGEANQLVAEIGKLQSPQLDVDALLHLRALCQELRRVLPDIVFYLDQKERTARFKDATKGPIDAEGYRVLAEIVTAMISSEKL